MPSFNTSQSQQRGVSRSRSRTGIVPGVMPLYQQQLQKQNENYGNLLDAHAAAQQNLSQNLSTAYGGFDTLQGNVMNSLQGQGTYQREQNRRTFEQAQGKSQQQLINSGLGNSSLLASMSNQNAQDYAQAGNDLSERLGRQSASALTNIGLARQGSMMQGAGMQADLAKSYMGDLGGYHFGNISGSLTGGFGESMSNNSGNSNSYGQSTDSPMRNAGGGGGMGSVPGLFSPHNPGQGSGIGGLGYGDVSALGGLYQPGYSPGGNMMGGAPSGGGGMSNFNISPTPESQGSNFNMYDLYQNNAQMNAGRV